MYMMVTFLLTSLLYYLLRCSNPKNKIKKKDMVLVNILMVLSMLTFYGSAFFILAFYIFTWRKKATFQQVSVYLPGFIIGLLLVEPLLTVQLLNAQETLKIVPNWASVLGKANLKNLLLIPVKFSMGRITFEPKPLYYTVAFFWVGFLFYVAARKARQYKFLSTLFLIFIFSTTTAIFPVYLSSSNFLPSSGAWVADQSSTGTDPLRIFLFFLRLSF